MKERKNVIVLLGLISYKLELKLFCHKLEVKLFCYKLELKFMIPRNGRNEIMKTNDRHFGKLLQTSYENNRIEFLNLNI